MAPNNQTPDPSQATTLIDYLMLKNQQAGNGTGAFSFDNQKKPGQEMGPMELKVGKGDVKLSTDDLHSMEALGQQIMDMAKKDNVDLTKFPEVKAAMGFDNDPNNLSPAELGAFMVSLSATPNLKTNVPFLDKVAAAVVVAGSAASQSEDDNAGLYRLGQRDMASGTRQANDIIGSSANDVKNVTAKTSQETPYEPLQPEVQQLVTAIGQQVYAGNYKDSSVDLKTATQNVDNQLTGKPSAPAMN